MTTKTFAFGDIFYHLITKRRLKDFFNFKPCVVERISVYKLLHFMTLKIITCTHYLLFSHLQPKSGQDCMLRQNSINKSDICVCELCKCASALCMSSSDASFVIYYLLLGIPKNMNVLYCNFSNVQCLRVTSDGYVHQSVLIK